MGKFRVWYSSPEANRMKRLKSHANRCAIVLALCACRSESASLSESAQSRVDIAVLEARIYPTASHEGSKGLHYPRRPQTQSNGTIVLGNDITTLLLISNDGHTVREIGRRGAGPGEFKDLWAFKILRGDSILAYDPGQRRMTLFSPEGQFVSTHPAMLYAGTGPVWLADGTAVGIDGAFNNRAFLMAKQRRGAIQDTSWVMVAQRGDTLAKQVWQTPGRHAFAGEIVTFEILFAGQPLIAALGSTVVVGQGEFDTLEVRDSDGRLISKFSSGLAREAVTPRLVTEYFDSASADGLTSVEESKAHAHIADSTPRFDRIATDRQNCIWVRRWSSPTSETSDWVVLDAHGSRKGVVRLPRSFRVSEIDAGSILGLEYDDDGVAAVATFSYRLRPACAIGRSGRP